jgi:ABC-type oligopeptide transport system substrate-binding subunit/serine/threonine protein kinase
MLSDGENVPQSALTGRGYEISKKLGAGGFGMVYLAQQVSVGREVAIKVILPEIAQDPLFEQRFEAEARVAAQLEHPNIVPLHDYWRDDDRAYLVMRYLRGGSLEEALSGGPWDLARASRLTEQIAGALDTAHRQGVIHRDLKSSNILLDEDGNAYLSDFGIAKHLVGTTIGTPTGAIMGSPAYMSPEQITGGEVTKASDIYSLGVVLYELVTGQTPFGEAEPATLLYKQLHEPLPLAPLACDWRPELPPTVDLVIQTATSKDPAERYASALELAAELRQSRASTEHFSSRVQGPIDTGAKPGELSDHDLLVENDRETTFPGLPSFFMENGSGPERQPPIFAGRREELTWLDSQLRLALEGQGRVVFVTGDAGSGKSSLMGHFGATAGEAIPDLLVARGICNAFSGRGDPYLPFRHILAMLTGDVESQWAAGSISGEQARRLWNASETTVQALVDSGPDLINTILPGKALLERTTTAVPNSALLVALRQRVQRAGRLAGDMERPQLFEQVATVLMELARERPLLLFLDDLQWADSGSIDLLFHLSRNLAGSRILITCAYRPEEIVVSRDGDSHPLQSLLHEFRRAFGEVWLDLDRSTGLDFVSDYLDSEPNRLGVEFRQTLYMHTNGHPLFTVELLRELQERGDLFQDAEGYWVEQAELDWGAMPARVEGVVEARIGRLEEELRELLTVAAVEGEAFTAQVVANVQEIKERNLLRTLSRELQRRHKLVQEAEVERIGRNQLNHYRFVHQMFWRYLYNDLTGTERRLLHGEIGEILEDLYEDRTEEITVQLARHFDEAGESEKAAVYLLAAGDRARTLYAQQEAIAHYQRALAHLELLGDDERIARTMMRLGLTYHNAFDYQRSQEVYDKGFAIWQGLTPRLPETPADRVLRINIPAHETLDPALIHDTNSEAWCDQIFSGLVEESPEMEIVPDIARRWEVQNDGRRYIFSLRNDVRWSDGKPVTSRDFTYAWRRVLDPESDWRLAQTLFDIKGGRAFHQGLLSDESQLGIRTPDDFTLVVELESPAAYFLHLMATSNALPVPRHAVESFGDRWSEPELIVTNGPFVIESMDLGGKHTLVRNPRYHGSLQGNVYRVEVLEDQLDALWLEKAVLLYEEGELDILNASLYPGDSLQALKARYGDQSLISPNLLLFGVTFNVQKPPFADRGVRQALAMAVDRDQLIRAVLKGQMVAAHGGLIPRGMAGHSPDIGLPYDPDMARRLLANAGYPGGDGFPEVEMLWPGIPVNVQESGYLQECWHRQLGIRVRERFLPFHDYSEIMKIDPPEIAMHGWMADYPDPDNVLRVAIGNVLDKWKDERFLERIETARRLMDHRERLEIYKEADKILMEEAVILPLTYGLSHYFIKPWVRHFPISPGKSWFLKDIVIDTH